MSAFWGSGPFVERLRREIEDTPPPCPRRITLTALVARVCRHVGIPSDALQGGGRPAAITHARAGIAYLWVTRLGRPGPPLAAGLGITAQSVYRAAQRGAETPAEWEQLLRKC